MERKEEVEDHHAVDDIMHAKEDKDEEQDQPLNLTTPSNQSTERQIDTLNRNNQLPSAPAVRFENPNVHGDHQNALSLGLNTVYLNFMDPNVTRTMNPADVDAARMVQHRRRVASNVLLRNTIDLMHLDVEQQMNQQHAAVTSIHHQEPRGLSHTLNEVNAMVAHTMVGQLPTVRRPYNTQQVREANEQQSVRQQQQQQPTPTPSTSTSSSSSTTTIFPNKK